MSQNKNIQSVLKPISVIWGNVAFISVLMLGSFIYSFMLLKDSVADTSAATASTVLLGISALIAGAVAGLINKNKGIPIGCLCAAAQIILILLFSIIFREKTPIFCAENWVKTGIIIICNIIGGIIGVNVKKKY